MLCKVRKVSWLRIRLFMIHLIILKLNKVWKEVLKREELTKFNNKRVKNSTLTKKLAIFKNFIV